MAKTKDYLISRSQRLPRITGPTANSRSRQVTRVGRSGILFAEAAEDRRVGRTVIGPYVALIDIVDECAIVKVIVD